MDIRRAVPEEAAEIKSLMIAAKRYRGYSDEWMAAWMRAVAHAGTCSLLLGAQLASPEDV